MRRHALALLLPLALAGCFGNADAPRFVHPELGPAPTTVAPAATATVVRLRPVRASSLLGEQRIVWRRSQVEVGYYEQERWTDPPPVFVERALERELFLRRGATRANDPAAPWSLEAEVTAFEEVLLPEHAVRIVLSVTIEDERQRTRAAREVEVVRPVPEDGLEPMARVMGAALADAARQVADLVMSTAAE